MLSSQSREFQSCFAQLLLQLQHLLLQLQHLLRKYFREISLCFRIFCFIYLSKKKQYNTINIDPPTIILYNQYIDPNKQKYNLY